MWVGSSSPAETVAFGLPVMNGSTSTRASPAVSSTAEWPRKRMSIAASVLPLHQFMGQLEADGDADQHAHPGLLGEQRTHSGEPLVDIRLAGGLQQDGLVSGA